MQQYDFRGTTIDSVELKCLVVSRGVKVSRDVYKRYSRTHRLGCESPDV